MGLVTDMVYLFQAAPQIRNYNKLEIHCLIVSEFRGLKRGCLHLEMLLLAMITLPLSTLILTERLKRFLQMCSRLRFSDRLLLTMYWLEATVPSVIMVALYLQRPQSLTKRNSPLFFKFRWWLELLTEEQMSLGLVWW